MLERFYVKEEDAVRVSEGALRESVASVFEKMNVSKEEAKVGSDALVTADLRGVETRGIQHASGLRSWLQLG